MGWLVLKNSLILIIFLISGCAGSSTFISNQAESQGLTSVISSANDSSLSSSIEPIKTPEYTIRPYEYIIRDQFPIWHFDNLIIPSDPTRLIGVKYVDVVTRYFGRNTTMQYIGTYQAYLYMATFINGYELEMLVEIGVSKDDADYLSKEVARQIGQVPELIAADLISFSIFVGDEHGQSGMNTEHWIKKINDIKAPYHEELIIHHLTHASIDWSQISPSNNTIISNKDNTTVIPQIGKLDKDEWIVAANLDNYFISDYARDNPLREDVAETIIAYLATSLRPERFDPKVIQILNERLKNRFLLLEKLEMKFP
jgi:hypothetical protein